MSNLDWVSADELRRFESLGDNCEFGFVQRAIGENPSGLLRWAISPPSSLMTALASDFDDFYQYPNLLPSAADMVRETRYDLFFHTSMRSFDKVFVEPEAARRQTYQAEKAKMDHLLTRFRARLADPATIFVYKTNAGVSDQQADDLRRAIRRYGPGHLLVVRTASDRGAWGTVQRRDDGLLIGHVDRFAPYSQADDVSVEVWRKLICNTLLAVDATPLIDKLRRNFNGIGELDYSIHIDPDLRFIYFNNPKCACTTIKASLNMSYAASIGKKLSYGSIGEIHDRAKNFMRTPREVGIETFERMLADERVVKFCFVREPLARLCSAYENKVRWPSPPLHSLANATGHDKEWRPTFDEFVAQVAGSPAARDCDEHWRLQTRQVCSDFVRYSFIGTFDWIERDLTRVLTGLFGGAASVFDVRRYFHGNASGGGQRLSDVSAEMVRAIATAYAQDVQLYRRACEALG
jgi:hypothetical protein